MNSEELNKIDAIMKKIFLVSGAIYAAFLICLFAFCAKYLTTVQLVLIVIFTPMVVGLVVLFFYKIKHPPVLDESEEDTDDVFGSEE